MSNCSNCGRDLTNVISVNFGIGPICRKGNIHTRAIDQMGGLNCNKHTPKNVLRAEESFGIPKMEVLAKVPPEKIIEASKAIKKICEEAGLITLEQKEDELLDNILKPENTHKLERVFKHLHDYPLDLQEDKDFSDIFKDPEAKKNIPWSKISKTLFEYSKVGIEGVGGLVSHTGKTLVGTTATGLLVAYKLCSMIDYAVHFPVQILSKKGRGYLRQKTQISNTVQGYLMLTSAMAKGKSQKEINNIIRKKKLYKKKLTQLFYRSYQKSSAMKEEKRKMAKAKSERRRRAKKTGKPAGKSPKENKLYKASLSRNYQQKAIRMEIQKKVLLDKVSRRINSKRADLYEAKLSSSPEKIAKAKRAYGKLLSEYRSVLNRKQELPEKGSTPKSFDNKLDQIHQTYQKILKDYERVGEDITSKNGSNVQSILNEVEKKKATLLEIAS